jgi:uncharacterized glyoxalase superfamily protein PhnB
VIFNRSVPSDTLLPHVSYPDVAEAVAWLTKTFGFTEHYRYGEPGEPSGAQMRLGNAWIMINQAPPGSATPAQLGYGTQSLTIFVEDVDAHFQRAKSAGARIVEDLHETEYGERQYGAEDLAGHHWLFSRHARDVSPDEWGATVSHPAAQMTIAPMLSVRNGARAIEFYQAAFGARLLFSVEDPDGAVVAQLSVGGSESLGGRSSVRMVVVVNDPDAAFQRAVTAGATTVWPVADQPYGWRVGRVVDPFGHHWEIGKPLPSGS